MILYDVCFLPAYFYDEIIKYGILKATFNSRTSVSLGKLPVVRRTLLCRRCNFERRVSAAVSVWSIGFGLFYRSFGLSICLSARLSVCRSVRRPGCRSVCRSLGWLIIETYQHSYRSNLQVLWVCYYVLKNIITWLSLILLKEPFNVGKYYVIFLMHVLQNLILRKKDSVLSPAEVWK
jgi:hypothetical protein